MGEQLLQLEHKETTTTACPEKLKKWQLFRRVLSPNPVDNSAIQNRSKDCNPM